MERVDHTTIPLGAGWFALHGLGGNTSHADTRAAERGGAPNEETPHPRSLTSPFSWRAWHGGSPSRPWRLPSSRAWHGGSPSRPWQLPSSHAWPAWPHA